jgi:DNA polymerase I-like protein with 3'-5' exonuclease and polymerase domains
MRLWQKYRPHVDSEMYELELTTTRILLHNSKRGIKVDEELVEQIYQEVNTSYVMLNDICQAQGFNPRAPQQLTYMLSSMGYWVPMDRKTHKLKGDKDTLKGINHPFAAAALAARQYSRLSSIMEKMRGRDRVYSQFKLDSATGRISSASMDGQPGYIQQHNLPTGRREGDIIPQAGPVRRVFVPDAWDKNSGLAWDSLEQPKFTRFDMSQVELRILAYLAQDQVMLRELNTVGGDIHSKTMRELGIFSRVMAKNMNFGVVYGGSPEVLRMFTGIQDLNLLAYYSQKIFNTYTEVKKWIDMMRIEGPRNGYVETLGGRKLSLAQAGKSGSERHVQNCAVNYPIQGTAAWIFKKVLKLLLEYMPIDEIILQVHDEGLLNGVQFVPGREIERITEIYTPIEVDYKPRWA